jgi:hypothetical protein
VPVNPLDALGVFSNYDLDNPDIAGYYAEYRFFVADFLTNTILQEIPFKDVGWQRSLKGAGEFSGKIEVIPPTTRVEGSSEPLSIDSGTAHLDLYNSTMPGKTCLYVVRNGVCVWGGIIWSRTYDIISRELEVSASEFTSYFYHRVVWKTINHEYFGVVQSTNGACVVTLSNYPEFQTVKIGGSVKVVFREIRDFRYNGYYKVTGILSADSRVFTINIPSLPTGTYPLTQINIRADTFDYVKQLLDSTFVDFINYSFSTEEIEPALGTDVRINRTEILNGVGTINTQGPHNSIENQVVYISNVNPIYNGFAAITQVLDPFTFRFAAPGLPNTASAFPPVLSRFVIQKQLINYKVTLTTSVPHGFQVSDSVVISGVDDGTNTVEIFDGVYFIAEVNSPNQFSYFCAGIYNQPLQSSGGTAVVTPTLTSGTYGSFPFNSEFGLKYDGEFSGDDAEPVRLRGHELRVVGKELEEYSDMLDGFEYRIDCDYDFERAEFTRTFVLLPIQLPDAPPEGQVSPVERFPGARELVFEHPGNVEQFTMEESAENAATRFFVSGNIPDLGRDVSQPYAAATSQFYMANGWPLLDEVEDRNDTYEEEELYSFANRYLLEAQPPLSRITLDVNGSMFPQIDSLKPGLWCSVIINDDEFFKERLVSPLEPRDDIIIRKINSVKVSVPNMPTFPEKVTLDLIPEWEVDKRGLD